MSQLNLAIKLSTKGSKVVVDDVRKVEESTRGLNQQLGYAGKAGKTAYSGLTQAGVGAKTLAKNSKSAELSLGGLVARVHVMGASFLSISAGLNAINRADKFNVLTQRIKTATKDTGDFVVVNQQLFAIAQKNGAQLEATVALFQNMATSREDLGATNSQMLQLVDTVQKLGVIGGSSSESMKNGLLQLSQAMSGGIVRAEEFNSILENIPELANRIAKGLGKTKGELRETVLAGKLLSKDVFNVILSQSKQVATDFDGIALSLDRAGQQASTSFDAALSKLDQSAGLTQGLANALVSVSETLDAMDASELQNIVATLTAIGGSVAALALLSKFKINLFAAGVASVSFAQSLSQQTAHAAKAKIQTNALGQVVKTTGTKMTTAAIATRGLGLALRTALGPIGLAISAGMLLYDVFAPDTIEASVTATDKLTLANKHLATSASELANKTAAPVNHLQQAYDKQAQLIVQIEVIKNAYVQVANTQGSQSLTAQRLSAQLQAQLLSLGSQKRLIASLVIQQTILADEKVREAAAAKVSKSAASQLASLKQQVALFNQHSKVKQLQYQIEHGALVGVDEKLKQQLLDEAAKLDLLIKQNAERLKNQPNKPSTDDTPLDANQQRELDDNLRHDKQAAELAAVRGFQVEESALIGLQDENKIAAAKARNLALQEEEYAHNEAVMAMKTRNTGDMQGTLMQFANFEKKTQLEKTSAVIGIGEYGFKAMAGQSKKAFAMYKAFSIGQALIKTYEAATGAYAALASIPIVGPALGAAAAAAAVMAGMAQVNQIKAQQPPGFERGGYIGDNNIIEFGERNKPEVLAFEGRNYLLGGNKGSVFNQTQLNEIDGGSSEPGGDTISISSPITIQGNADESVIAELIERNYEAVYNAMVQAKADRGEAA